MKRLVNTLTLHPQAIVNEYKRGEKTWLKNMKQGFPRSLERRENLAQESETRFPKIHIKGSVKKIHQIMMCYIYWKTKHIVEVQLSNNKTNNQQGTNSPQQKLAPKKAIHVQKYTPNQHRYVVQTGRMTNTCYDYGLLGHYSPKCLELRQKNRLSYLMIIVKVKVISLHNFLDLKVRKCWSNISNLILKLHHIIMM
ncbi:hypothetical protein O6H91_22G009100 [Diphasiastrum complanatum]|uniref:Uncharacterized protein n=1 Tax=Diphasiastrum complanatum TaxID=34168 RepID=A0ACC2ADV8_DIPCM|nr:hypothetical protein O6H91_22G009100 [Diphasiastrum complanatum]